MKKRIYLVGEVYSSYRARALLEYLASSPIYAFYYSDPRYLMPSNHVFLNRIIFKFARILDRLYGLLKLYLADIVYILPMASLNSVERFFVKIFSKRVVSEFYISFYDTLVNDRKTVKAESHAANRLLARDRNLLDISDAIIFLNNAEKKYYLGVVGGDYLGKEIHTIELCTSRRELARLPFANSIIDELVLCWWGTFIPLHGLDKIVASAKILKKMDVKFKMYLFGTSVALSEPYLEYIVKEDLSDYVFIDNSKNFSDSTLEDFLVANCDIAFGHFGDSEKAKNGMPNKIVEAASMGIPVISQRTPALDEYYQDKNNIIFSEPSPEAIAKSVIDLSLNKNLQKKLSEQSYHLYRKQFSKDIYIHKVSAILASSNKT